MKNFQNKNNSFQQATSKVNENETLGLSVDIENMANENSNLIKKLEKEAKDLAKLIEKETSKQELLILNKEDKIEDIRKIEGFSQVLTGEINPYFDPNFSDNSIEKIPNIGGGQIPLTLTMSNAFHDSEGWEATGEMGPDHEIKF